MLVIGLAGGFTVLGAGIAASTATADEQAPVVGLAAAGQTAADDENDETSGENGTGSGNQVEADAEAPVNATDNQVTVIGDGNQSHGGGAEPENGVEPDADVDHTSGDDGTLSGNQVDAQVEAPVELSGNQVTVIGDGNTAEGSTAGSCQEEEEKSSGDTTNGDDGLLSGNQVDVDADAPVDASGNQVTVIGDENTSGGTSEDGCRTATGSDGSDSDGASTDDADGGDTTSGEDGTGSGNQLTLDPDAPADASGNQVTVIGDGNQSGGSTGDGAGDGDAGDSDDGDTTSGEHGTGAGNQVTLDPVARLGADDNQLTVVGNGNENGGPGGDDGNGDDGTGGSGDPDGDGDGDAPGDNGPGGSEPGDRRDGEVRGTGAGGPGRPGVVALGGLPADAAPATEVLPQTGAEHGPGLGLLALALLLAGCALIVLRRREAEV
jgi:LPXTG-motif cell wall-anchored protein